LEERGKRGDSSRFADHAALLQDNGFSLLISLVANAERTSEIWRSGGAVEAGKTDTKIVPRNVGREALSQGVQTSSGAASDRRRDHRLPR